MDPKIIELAERGEMLKSLLRVNDEPRMQHRFYPILLEDAGRKFYPEGVAMVMLLAIYDYTKDMPPFMFGSFNVHAPKFIDALVSDQEAAAEAKKFLQEWLSAPAK
jgi:hypothetical protein